MRHKGWRCQHHIFHSLPSSLNSLWLVKVSSISYPDYQGPSQIIRDHKVPSNIRYYQGSSWTIMDCQGPSGTKYPDHLFNSVNVFVLRCSQCLHRRVDQLFKIVNGAIYSSLVVLLNSWLTWTGFYWQSCCPCKVYEDQGTFQQLRSCTEMKS